MASVGAEEVDYDSDPEEAKRPLAMRRREASDDEEGEGGGGEKRRADRRGGINSDESDGEGGAAEYEDDEEELGLEDEEEEEIDDEEEEVDEGEEVYEESGRGLEGGGGAGGVESLAVAIPKEVAGNGRGPVEESVEAHGGSQAEGEEEKKEHEPFAVPTAGAFYMHDDRFRDNAGGRHRYNFVRCDFRGLWKFTPVIWLFYRLPLYTFYRFKDFSLMVLSDIVCRGLWSHVIGLFY